MHRTAVRPNLDVLDRVVTLDGETIYGVVTDISRAGNSHIVFAKVRGDDRWHRLPESVSTLARRIAPSDYEDGED